jgi:Na+/H+ antiporter NhaA
MTTLDPAGMSTTGPTTSPLRAFLHTEAAGAAALAAAIVLALVWANVTVTGYDGFWSTELPLRIDRTRGLSPFEF